MKPPMLTTAMAAALTVAGCNSAQTTADSKADARATPTADATHSGSGMVERVSGTDVTIAHGPVETLGWPAMTMTFAASDAALLQGIRTGDRVSFAFRKAGDGYALSSISKQ